jgi:hypothetical protein
MYGSSDKALRLLDQATSVRDHADKVWRSAIREALATDAPVEHVALWARTTIDNVLIIVNELHAEAAISR